MYNFLKPSNVIFPSKIFSWDNLKIPIRMIKTEIFIVSRCQVTPSSFPIQTFSFLIVKLSNNFRLICGVKNFWKEWGKKLVSHFNGIVLSQINKVFYSKIHPIDEILYWSQVWLTLGHEFFTPLQKFFTPHILHTPPFSIVLTITNPLNKTWQKHSWVWNYETRKPYSLWSYWERWWVMSPLSPLGRILKLVTSTVSSYEVSILQTQVLQSYTYPSAKTAGGILILNFFIHYQSDLSVPYPQVQITWYLEVKDLKSFKFKISWQSLNNNFFSKYPKSLQQSLRDSFSYHQNHSQKVWWEHLKSEFG